MAAGPVATAANSAVAAVSGGGAGGGGGAGKATGTIIGGGGVTSHSKLAELERLRRSANESAQRGGSGGAGGEESREQDPNAIPVGAKVEQLSEWSGMVESELGGLIRRLFFLLNAWLRLQVRRLRAQVGGWITPAPRPPPPAPQ